MCIAYWVKVDTHIYADWLGVRMCIYCIGSGIRKYCSENAVQLLYRSYNALPAPNASIDTTPAILRLLFLTCRAQINWYPDTDTWYLPRPNQVQFLIAIPDLLFLTALVLD